MNKYINKIAVATLAMAGFMTTSCELTEDNPSGGSAQLDLFLNWKGLQAVSYSTLNDELYTASDWYISSEGGTDCWFASGNGDGYRSDINYENYATNNNSTSKLWLQCYSMIANCNTVINEAGNITDGENVQDDIKVLVAETKVLRAFYNFLLVSNFGPVTLNLESATGFTGKIDLNPVRSSEKDFYTQIIKDLTEAEPDLGVTPYENNRARVTKKTALGLLARVYAQRAGLGDSKYGDGATYWQLAAKTAENLIQNAATYGAHLYSDIADMWADANNRTNKEALFIAAGADAYSDAWNLTTRRNKLFAYSCGGVYQTLFNQNPTKKGTHYFYGRINAQTFVPSRYLMYCFDPEWDRRWEYSFVYAYGDYSMVQCGWVKYSKGQKTLTDQLCQDYGIDISHSGEIIYPFADCDGIASTFGGNQYPAKIWPKGETSGDKSKLLSVATSGAEVNDPTTCGSTKAYAVPYPVALDDNRLNTVFVHKKLSDADKAKCRYAVVCLDDLYGSNGMNYGNVVNGSEKANPPAIGNGLTSASACPSLSKFNWSYNGAFWGSEAQIKTGDMFIMRMAEVYLLAAEAEQKLGNGPTAAGYLNTLRERAARPGVARSTWELATATEDDIFDEYAREMCGEFNRWLLLKRHNAFETRLAKYNPRAAKSFKPYMYNRPVSSQFLQQILNDDEYGDNGYGQTPTSGLENIDTP
ncbi:MAG: RagB/SusD family nutrient uptake outer membrane protein, partial [Muribaculum sp.]|nr:RagB/SusD family nutrient uptake outer membrane protein [Muribaculum sp.]